MPAALIERSGAKGLCFERGHELFQQDRPAAAWRWFEQGLRTRRPSVDEYLLGAMCLYHGLGRFRDAVSLLARSNELGAAEAERLDCAEAPFRVLDSVWARHIGHTANIDYVIKLGILEGRRREDTILYLPPGSPVANRFLLRQIATELRVIENQSELPFDASAVQALHYDLLGPRLPDGTTAYIWDVASKTYRRWHEEGRGPLLVLPSETAARGWAALRSAGVPDDAWFVALHVREGRWDGQDAGLHGILNADISKYLPAIAEVTRRGGWVIRMGDPDMKPLPPLSKVIDYCHTALQADWMDVFIAAKCRFMISTSSGPGYLPILYGVPSVRTNWWPPAARPWHASDIFIPKMLRRSADNGYLTLSEILREPFSWCHSRGYIAEQGVRVEDSDPELIRAAVQEMLARLDDDLRPDAEVTELRLRSDRIYETNGVLGMSCLAAAFLHRHGDVIA
jgi:putative glycosyltransferase (TIGR04372 family)